MAASGGDSKEDNDAPNVKRIQCNKVKRYCNRIQPSFSVDIRTNYGAGTVSRITVNLRLVF